MIRLLLYGFLALSILGMIGTGVYKVKQWGANEVRAEWAQAVKEQQERETAQIAGAATKREEDRAKAKVIYKTIKERVVEYIDRPVYSTVCIDSDGMRDVNAALLGKSASSTEFDGGVPTPAAPNR